MHSVASGRCWCLRSSWPRSLDYGLRLSGLVQTALVTTFSVATNEYRGGNGERTEYHACVAWDRLAEICGQFLSKR